LLAEWIDAGEPSCDLWWVDPARFSPGNDRAFLRDRVSEVVGWHYTMAWPSRATTGRDVHRSPL
jgi:4-methylaminobutanoate oxidase (formaldehyde-forming)